MQKQMARVLSSIIPIKKWRKKIRNNLMGKNITFEEIKEIEKNYLVVQQHLRKKVLLNKKIKVVFFVYQFSLWRLGELYYLLEADPIFEPYIIVIPFREYNDKNSEATLKKEYEYFKNVGYANVINSYNETTRQFWNIKKKLNPDLIFFPIAINLAHPYYNIKRYLDKLTYYVPYSIMTANTVQTQFNQVFHNICWKMFYETPLHFEMAKKYALNKGANVVVKGYPVFDIINVKNKQSDPWKKQNKIKKRIIWAPHHSIYEGKGRKEYACFLYLYEFMFDVALKYEDEVQIAFKPHPLLRRRLLNDKIWSLKEIDNYYQKWHYLNNGQLEENDYADLFLYSDAMIMDSLSFMTEYLLTEKPILFTLREKGNPIKFNDFGTLNFEVLYKTVKLKTDIINFIENVLLKNDDYMKDERKSFIQNNLRYYNNSTCENIYRSLKDDLNLK